MEKIFKIAASILNADFSRLAEEIKKVESLGVDMIHIDIMDGHFVPNISIGPMVVKAINSVTSLPLDVHLMIENPDDYLEEFAIAGSDIITVQLETCTHLYRTIQRIKELKVKPSVALNPASLPEELEYILENIDMILIMTVEPGFGGQPFIPSMLKKIKKTKEIIKNKGLNIDIEVDGGIKRVNIEKVRDAGANIFVLGTEIFKNNDYAAVITDVKEKLFK